MPKVLVLGGTGFLGTHVVRAFDRSGCEVEIASRRTGIDARDAELISRFTTRCQPNIVVNCIQHGGGIAYNTRCPVAIFEDNLITGFNALRAAVKAGAEKFVSIMGNSSYPGALKRHEESCWWDGPLHESVLASAMPRKALWTQAWAYQKEFEFRSIHVVLPNMYGPGDHFEPERSHALAALLRKIWEAKHSGIEQVEIWGTGKPVREWLYVEDAAEGIVCATERHDGIEILNIGRGEGQSICELAEMIREILNWQGEFVYDTTRPDGAPVKTFDTVNMMTKLRWRPATSLQDGLRKTIDWFALQQGDRTAAAHNF